MSISCGIKHFRFALRSPLLNRGRAVVESLLICGLNLFYCLSDFIVVSATLLLSKQVFDDSNLFQVLRIQICRLTQGMSCESFWKLFRSFYGSFRVSRGRKIISNDNNLIFLFLSLSFVDYIWPRTQWFVPNLPRTCLHFLI